MKIRHIVPGSPKFGTEEHIENTVGRTLVAAGFAEEIAYKGFQERLAAEQALRQKTAPPPAAAQWAVQDSVSCGRKIMVVKTYLGVVTYFDAPPADCPLQVRQRWQVKIDLERGLINDQPKIDKAKREHAVQQERERNARLY